MKSLLNGRYVIIDEIGSGKCGHTFLCRDDQSTDKRACVIRELRPQTGPEILETLKRRFQVQTRILRGLGEHDQIAELYDSFENEGNFYLVQEFIEGENLGKKIREQGRLPEIEVKPILLSILEALAYIHSKGIVHCDIKPENIILRGQDHKAVLIDFGLIKQSVDAYDLGTLGYSSPEQVRGAPSYASDIYSLGCTAIYLLTGKLPQEVKRPSPSKVTWTDYSSLVSPELAGILDRAIADEQKKRFKNAQQMLSAIRNPTQFNAHPVAEAYKRFTSKLTHLFSYFYRKIVPFVVWLIVVIVISALLVKILPLLWFWGTNKSEQVSRWIHSTPAPKAGTPTPSLSPLPKPTMAVVQITPSPTAVVRLSPTPTASAIEITPPSPKPSPTKTVIQAAPSPIKPSPTIAIKTTPSPKMTPTPRPVPTTVTVEALFVYKLDGGPERPFPQHSAVQLKTVHIDPKTRKEKVDFGVSSEISERGYVRFESVPCKTRFKITLDRIDIPEGAARLLKSPIRPTGYPKDTDLLKCESIAPVGKYVLPLALRKTEPRPTPTPTPGPPEPIPTPRPRPTPIAPEPEPTPSQTLKVSGGVLQGRAIYKPQPSYPPLAKSARRQGIVQVRVLISEQGKVIDASVISGDSFLQDAALQAAKRWVFQPTTLSGVPVKVEGVLTFNFTL